MEEKGFEIKNIPEDEKSSQNDRFFDGFSVDDLNLSEPEPEKKPEIQKGKRKKKKKTNGILKSVIWIAAIVVISLGIAFGIIYAGADYLGIGFGRGKSCVMEIPEGSVTSEISERLSDSGAVKIPILFRLFSKFKHYDSQYKYGVYRFKTDLGYEDIAEMLMTEGAKANTKTVKIPEAATVDDIADILEENGICERSDFINVVQNGTFDYDFLKDIPEQSVYYRLEGYLFADTYNFYACDNSEDGAYLAVELMLSNFEKKTANIRVQAEKSDYSFHEIMTMASIVELEAGGSPEEAPKVAAVFYNRLKSDEFSTLGSSPTRKYPHGNGRYDTYTAPGLPPGPLCAASVASIKAALNPDKDMDCYYFVTDAKMNFYFRKTLAEHNAIIAKLQAENNWIYEE